MWVSARILQVFGLNSTLILSTNTIQSPLHRFQICFFPVVYHLCHVPPPPLFILYCHLILIDLWQRTHNTFVALTIQSKTLKLHHFSKSIFFLLLKVSSCLNMFLDMCMHVFCLSNYVCMCVCFNISGLLVGPCAPPSWKILTKM